jgi:hypothetical protein
MDKTHLQKKLKDSLVVDGKENCLSIFLYQHQCKGQNTYLIKTRSWHQAKVVSTLGIDLTNLKISLLLLLLLFCCSIATSENLPLFERSKSLHIAISSEFQLFSSIAIFLKICLFFPTLSRCRMTCSSRLDTFTKP